MKTTVAEALARLDAAVASGAIAGLCQRFGAELLVLFGSSVDGDAPSDVDVAVAFVHGVDPDLLGFADDLAELVPGDHLDLMNLADAGPVAYHRALTHCRVLYGASSAAFAEREIFAITHYLETQPLRDLLLESLAS